MSQYPMSVHMVHHFLLALVIPALLLLATPRCFAETVLQRPLARMLERTVGQPPFSWLLGVGAMLAWHIPALFNAQLASFLIGGVIFWWPILGPLQDRHLPALAAVAYLFTACVSCSLMGAFLTFGPVLYAHHAKSDQELAGMLMWVPGCFVYLSAILTTVLRWYGMERAA
jgi:putative membrane protein